MKRLVVLISFVVLASFTFGEMKSSVSRHGLTWTFDKQYQCGQYVNGDWWVIGPVKVTTISPAPANGMHGSMVNPTQMTAVVAQRHLVATRKLPFIGTQSIHTIKAGGGPETIRIDSEMLEDFVPRHSS